MPLFQVLLRKIETDTGAASRGQSQLQLCWQRLAQADFSLAELLAYPHELDILQNIDKTLKPQKSGQQKI